MTDAEVFPGEGVTESERYLSRLCRRTFLSLWSYSGIFRDQGRRDGQGDGKELCDLLVVFDNHIIIFSDKNCEFPNSGNLMVDWGRWYKKAILKSADQVFGAERWLVDFPERVFLDRNCTQSFPLDIPAIADAQIHRVVVSHGAEAKCRAVLGGSGSLAIRPDVVGPVHFDHQRHNVDPFTIGNIDPAKGFVHVLDDTSLNLVLTELDTITDFVRYLGDKERLVQSGSLEFAAGEEDLLAHYLYPLEGREKNGFMVPEGGRLRVGARLWDSFVRDDFRRARQDANRISGTDDIVGIASELGTGESRSFDIAYVDGAAYTQPELREAKKRVDALGLMKNVSTSFGEEFDYPHPDAMPTPNFFTWKPAKMKGKERNRPCPCGSGRKMKH